VVARLASSGRRWYAEDFALQPDLYLRDVDPEQDGFGVTSALSLWLMLDEEGWTRVLKKRSARVRSRAGNAPGHRINLWMQVAIQFGVVVLACIAYLVPLFLNFLGTRYLGSS